MINSNKLNGRIRELGLTQRDCANILKISAPTMNQKINNIRPMSLNEASKLSDFLNIPIQEFPVYFFWNPVA